MSEEVRSMFGRIAPRYDRANTVLSLGRHRRWRRCLVRWSRPPRGGEVLDVATGTGDLAFEFERAVGPSGRVVGLDFSAPMIEQARAKAAQAGSTVTFREGDALRLPFADKSFDVASIAFGIRNVDDPSRALREMARVVRPRGRVAVLEFGQPRGLLGLVYRAYSRLVLPTVGGRITGERSAYQYLDRTAARFPAGPRFAQMMQDTGAFEDVTARRLDGGIVYAYIGTVAALRKA